MCASPLKNPSICDKLSKQADKQKEGAQNGTEEENSACSQYYEG